MGLKELKTIQVEKEKLQIERVRLRKELMEFQKKVHLNDEKIQEISNDKEVLSKEIKKAFSSKSILVDKTYTNEEMIHQYELILELFGYYQNPQNINSNGSQNWNPDFINTIDQITNKLKGLRAGKRGEKNVCKVIQLFDDKVMYISNFRCKYDELDTENDLIVISQCGVFTLEIKNWEKSACVTNRGFLVTEQGENSNVVEQQIRHCSALRKILEKHLDGIDMDIFPILVWENQKSDIQDNYGKIPICFPNDVSYEILNTEKYPGNYSKKMQRKIYNILLNENLGSRSYPHGIERESFINSFIQGAYKNFEESLLPIKQQKNKIELLEEQICVLKAKEAKMLKEKKEHPVRYSVKVTGKKAAKGTGKILKNVGITILDIVAIAYGVMDE